MYISSISLHFHSIPQDIHRILICCTRIIIVIISSIIIRNSKGTLRKQNQGKWSDSSLHQKGPKEKKRPYHTSSAFPFSIQCEWRKKEDKAQVVCAMHSYYCEERAKEKSPISQHTTTYIE